MDFWTDPLGLIRAWLLSLLMSIGLTADAAGVALIVLGTVVVGGLGLTLPLALIYIERRLIGRFQDRIGPNRVGPEGIFQTVADAIKLLIKEDITPLGADKFIYNLAPVMAVVSVLTMWAILPFAYNVFGTDLNVGALYFVSVGSLGTLAIMLGGWASNNKYALLGAFRTVAQMVCYEVPMILAILVPVLLASSMSMNAISQAQNQVWFLFSAPVAAFIFFITSVAETGRAPFDLLEAESEIVAGFNIEYSGMKFGMFFVGEFLHAFTVGALTATLFMGGWTGPGAENNAILGILYFAIKSFAAYFIVIWMRATFPRIRIDHMLELNWKFLVPLALGSILTTMLVDKLYAEYLQALFVEGAQAYVRGGLLFLGNVALAAVALVIATRAARYMRLKEESDKYMPVVEEGHGHDDHGHGDHGHETHGAAVAAH
ncbi:MAG TPA: NADH-quinone oxidoreductase subunit NuoH [Anaerolineales bacterium]|nr:NADH-quinone oxidoreductase subunit NuoH [Anaerolineales bacterium]